MDGYSPDEYLAILLSRYVRDRETAACGMVSPIPAAALMLAEQHHAPNATIIILGSEEYDPFFRKGFSGSADFHFMAQRGELDLFFASGLQIDAEANVNLHLLGEHDTPRLRMPGAYGIGLLYYMARRVVVFRTEHTRRSLVEKVDFVTAAGSSPREFHRAGGPTALVTPKATLAWDAGDRKWLLASIHSGISLEDVLENMAFQPDVSAPVPVAPPPDPEELYILRTVVKQKLARVYPDLAARIPSP